jgi:creatinine amidohydrolase
MLTLVGVMSRLLAGVGILLLPVAAAAEPPGALADLPVRWEELTAPDFVKAIDRSGGVCVIPLGIIEKHGPHLPLGTDLLAARELALRAVAREYAIVFPPYYLGQIFEARHQPGTLAYSERLVFDLLQETVEEVARNGIKKIVLVNGHGGNEHFLPFFCQSQLARRRDYAVYLFQPPEDAEADARLQRLRRTALDMHAGEVETGRMLAIRPDLVRLDQAKDQSGADQGGLADLRDAYTGIWWYARFPNHYAGDGGSATRELGELALDLRVHQLVAMLRSVKSDSKTLELQNRFFDEAQAPRATPQR